jgi:pyruvate ferredoxin oxidoreductase gamma subunit
VHRARQRAGAEARRPAAALLGGFAAVCDQVLLESVFAAIREKFAGKVAEGNVAAAREAYDIVMKEREEASHA